MKNYLKIELRRAILSKTAIISFIITFLVLFVAFLEFVHFPRFSISSLRDRYDAIYLFIRIRYSTKASILALVAPLLASLVFSDSYLLDKESGFLKFIYLRIGQKKYLWTKVIVNSIASGVVIRLASFVMLIFLICVYGIKDVNAINLRPFSWIYYESRLLYAILLILVSFIFNVIFANLALGISPWIKNRYLTFVFPFFYYIISGTLLPFYLNGTILFTLNSHSTEFNIIIYQLALFLLGVVMFYFGVMYRDEKNVIGLY